jgi:hypothetical protein
MPGGVNVVGHLCVARTRSDDPLVWLGAMVPDLRREAGAPADGERWPDPVPLGIRWHHLTDDAFHRAQAFVDGMVALRIDLERRGLPRGPARALSHAGFELLLDGALLADPETADAYTATFEAGIGACHDLDPHHRDRWRPALARRHDHGPVNWYADPALVADRLHRILARRPLLAFDADCLPAVESTLAEHQPAIAAVAPALVDAATRWDDTD